MEVEVVRELTGRTVMEGVVLGWVVAWIGLWISNYV